MFRHKVDNPAPIGATKRNDDCFLRVLYKGDNGDGRDGPKTGRVAHASRAEPVWFAAATSSEARSPLLQQKPGLKRNQNSRERKKKQRVKVPRYCLRPFASLYSSLKISPTSSSITLSSVTLISFPSSPLRTSFTYTAVTLRLMAERAPRMTPGRRLE